jgi:urease accessory protein
LQLTYTFEEGRTRAHDLHSGPLRVLQALYPEGPGICHHVLVHPPGGIVGGDVLQLSAQVGEGAHALITTPSATRFYKSGGYPAAQRAVLRLQTNARLEWLPLETIAYPGCEAENAVQFELAPGASVLGWDVLVLGLPRADAAFTQPSAHFAPGWFCQHLEWPGVWLERGHLAAGDTTLLQSAVGCAGHTVLATAWLATGTAWPAAPHAELLAAARDVVAAHPLAATAGVTSPHAGLLVLRLLAHRVDEAMGLLQAVRAAWRQLAWGLAAQPPRVWRS